MKKLATIVSFVIAVSMTSWNVQAYQTRQEISFGDFESGRVLWFTTNYTGGASTSSGIISNSAKAYGGSWYGYIGDYTTNTFSADGALFQYMVLTNTTTNLDVSFYLNISSLDSLTIAYDNLSVFLRHLDQNGNMIRDDPIAQFSNKDRSAGTGTANYSFKSYHVPISSPGKIQVLMFRAVTDSSLYTVFRIDNVSAVSYFPDPVVNYNVHSFIENGNGSMSPTGNTSVVSGSSLSFSATPSSDWEIGNWKVNGSIQQIGGSSFTLNNITANSDVSVSFTRTLHQLNINVIQGSGTYTLSPSGGWYTNGTLITLTAVPSSGYQFSEWNGATYSRESQITFNMSSTPIPLGIIKPMGLGDISINLSFVQIISQPPNVGIRSSGSIPTFTVNPVQDWLTVIETTWDLANGVWAPVSVHQGNQSIDFTFPQGQNSGFIRSSVWPLVLAPGFMKFPIHDGVLPHTWLTAEVTAIMDHYPEGREAAHTNAESNQITTYLGNSFKIDNHDSLGDWSDITGKIIRPFEFKYVGVPGDQKGPLGLQYNNHQGYDYNFSDPNIDVYPVYGGETVTDNDDFVKTSNWKDIPGKYMDIYHAVIIRHKNSDGTYMGFCTIYMHLSDVYPDYVDKTDTNSWKPKKSIVNVNTPIGKVGNFYKGKTINTHLHLGVWMLINANENKWIAVDPYGTQTINSNIVYRPLWTD